MTQDTVISVSPDKEFEIFGYDVHKLTKYVGILSILCALLVLLVEVFGKELLISLDTIVDITTAVLLIYGHSKQCRYFYIPYLLVTVFNFLGLSSAMIFGIWYGSYCLLFNSTNCKHNWSSFMAFGVFMLFAAFVEGLASWIVWRGYQYLVRQASQPLPTLSYQNPVANV